MKRLHLSCKHLLGFLLILSIVGISCGIESVIYLKRPERTYHTSYLEDMSKRYCQFNTADSDNTANAGDYFQGTEIYYRIYEREADCVNETDQINQYNENNPSNSAQYLQETKKYYRLSTSNVSKRPLIDKHASDALVRFRLQDYGGSVDPAALMVNGVSLGIPQRDRRLLVAKRNFDRLSISNSDEDVRSASSSTGVDTYWRVHFYAASYGYDKTFKTLYSDIVPLGFIKIKKTP